MKVILTAFGDRLRSEVMEWPEAVGPDPRMRFMWRRHDIAFKTFTGDTRCAPDGFGEELFLEVEFAPTGRSIEQEDGSLAREYELVNWREV
jgi:hypothetical protein